MQINLNTKVQRVFALYNSTRRAIPRQRNRFLPTLAVISACWLPFSASADERATDASFEQDEEDRVTLATFVRAETDTEMRRIVETTGGLGTFIHLRQPAPLDHQPVIRMNRDTIYSAAVIDLTNPVIVTLPEGDGRYQSLQVINQDHYMYAVSDPGSYTLNQQAVGTRYAYLVIRTFVDPNDPANVAAANVMQDAVTIEGGEGVFEAPFWDQDQLLIARQALNELSLLGTQPELGFGTREEADPIQHLAVTASGWGGLPSKNAIYQAPPVAQSDGTPHALTVGDVPVDAFWSVTVYNSEGYMEPNDLGVNNINSVTSIANDDGSVTIHFGECDDGRINCLPVTPGWNYVARLYEPRAEIQDGSWSFPEPSPVE